MFDKVKPSERLRFELLVESNLVHLYRIFKENDNPYVTEDYKDFDKLKMYYADMQQLRTSQSKYAGYDWLLRLKDSETYIGVISIYDLSRETINDKDRKCSLGFAIGDAFRRKYFATESIQHIFNFVKNDLDRSLVLAYTNNENLASIRLLQKFGFEDVTDEYTGGSDIQFYHLEI
ncbi:MAG: GNAT family N-acetyltransferase [Saprospiraceae bacterium]|nr:GNAT family N-acetyltransferase [Saprospiraceae bacterium]